MTTPINGGTHWSPADEDELERLWRAGRPDTEIAAALGRSVESVQIKRYWLRLVGGCRRPFTTLELAYLREHTSTMTVAAMARHLGRSYNAVARAMSYYGIEAQFRPRYDVYERKTGVKVCENATIDEALAKLCISREAFFAAQNRTRNGVSVRWLVYRVNGYGQGDDA